MKQIMAVFFLLTPSLMPIVVNADALALSVQNIEAEWAHIHYNVAKQQQEAAYKHLLAEVSDLNELYSDQAELIIQQAIIVASNAKNVGAFSALEAVKQARELLLRAIHLNPAASEGAAFVTLGSLYYKVPSWPIAYGDNSKASTLLKKALTINPDSIDANYFYGDFLATQGKQQQAITYFKRAMAIPVRKNQVFADTQLHKQAKLAIIENGQRIATK